MDTKHCKTLNGQRHGCIGPYKPVTTAELLVPEVNADCNVSLLRQKPGGCSCAVEKGL